MSTQYHKISNIFKRDLTKPYLTKSSAQLIFGDWARPEFQYLSNCWWHLTEKVDGMNIRVTLEDGTVTFGGKTDNAMLPPKLSAWLGATFNPLVDLMYEMWPAGAVLYGEGYGAKIQKAGHLYGPDQKFVLFDVRVRDVNGHHWWLRQEDVTDVAKRLGIERAPFIGYSTLWHAIAVMRDDALPSAWGDFPAEGVVARPKHELVDRAGNRIIAKLRRIDYQHLGDS